MTTEKPCPVQRILERYTGDLSGSFFFFQPISQSREAVSRLYQSARTEAFHLLRPKVLIADEPTSMVDACSRSSILDMLLKLRDENSMMIIFITHDVGLAYYVSDTLLIMEKGKIVERGEAENVLLHHKHPYTKQLIEGVPKIHSVWNLA